MVAVQGFETVGAKDGVLVGIAVALDDSVSVAYMGPGAAALFGETFTAGDVAQALHVAPADEASLLDSIRASAHGAAPWRFAWRVSRAAGGDVELRGVALPVTRSDGTTLHGYIDVARGPSNESLDHSIVAASPVPYAINDEHQNITYVNPAFVATFGYSLDDIPTLSDWWPRAYPDPEYRAWAIAEWGVRLERAIAAGTAFEPFEVKIHAKDGTHRFAVVGALSLDRSLTGTHAVVLLDVTERKRAEESRLGLERHALQSQKLESLGLLAGGIAHDFNNLLMAIVGNADVALADLPAESPARASIRAIQVSARRASSIADQMLAYAGRGKFVVEPLSISNLVAEMSQLLEVTISKNVLLRRDLQKGLPSFDGDATQIGQVVMNLIKNASEAIGDVPGVVTICTGETTCDRAFLDGATLVRGSLHNPSLREGRYVFLSIADTGSGMTTDTIARIFEPFFTTKFTGRGLGLSALLGIVQGHAGAVEIRSALGAGTTIRVLFPANSAGEELTPAVSRMVEVPATSGGGLILLVDDEEAIRQAVQQMLEELGYTVLVAADGSAAVELFREHAREIAAVVLELTMPVMSGEQAIRELRALRPDVKVIMASGYTSFDLSRRFASGGPAGFLKKPFSLDELQQAITGALRS